MSTLATNMTTNSTPDFIWVSPDFINVLFLFQDPIQNPARPLCVLCSVTVSQSFLGFDDLDDVEA